MRRWVRALFLCAAPVLSTAGVASAFSGPDYPNILFILADDLGYGDLGCLNPESKIPTPHIDRLAASGLRFTDAHSPSAVCTPTRYGVLTGRYCWRTSLTSGVLWNGYARALIEPGRETVASLLRRHGYHTGCVGKWHLRFNWASTDGNPRAKSNNPRESASPVLVPLPRER